jgi:hypothetical protein
VENRDAPDDVPSRRPDPDAPPPRRPGGLRAALDPAALPTLLLFAAAAELVVYRLAVPALAGAPDAAPPWWHAALSYSGLFLFYFASALAGFLIAGRLIAMVRDRQPYAAPARLVLAATGLTFVGLALWALSRAPGETLSFVLEASFVAAIIALVAAQVGRGGQLGARLGLVLLALPLIIHFWGPLATRYLDGEEALWNGLPERVQAIGLKLLVIAAIASPYCFAPRPFLEAASRPAPLAIGVFVGLVGAVIMRQSHKVGFEMAANGLGIDLGAGAPPSEIALYLLALSAVTWSIVACLSADAPARRRIGVGIGLVVVSGYAFAWPLQYLAGLAGLLTIGEAARVVKDEEQTTQRGQAVRFRAPPVGDEVWNGWIKALTERLAGHGARAVTVRGEGGAARSHIVATAAGLPLRVTIERIAGSVTGIDVVVGIDPGGAPPGWTLKARGERRLGLDLHPDPPPCDGAPHKTGDAAFDRRFRVRDAGGHTDLLFDDGLRARAAATLDGWLALWPGRALRFRVHPGRGAPLDHPVPISELAFRGAEPPPSTDRLAALIELLVELGSRAGVAAAPAMLASTESTDG